MSKPAPLPTTQLQFVNELNSIAYSAGLLVQRVFTDWVQMIVCALSMAQSMHIIPLMIVDKLMQERCYKAVLKASSILATAVLSYTMPTVNVEENAKFFKATADGGLGERMNFNPKPKPSEPSAN